MNTARQSGTQHTAALQRYPGNQTNASVGGRVNAQHNTGDRRGTPEQPDADAQPDTQSDAQPDGGIQPDVVSSRLPVAPRTPYLGHMMITSFGAFADKSVGPFTPHLNVVFGNNEAGKTTLAAFVGGVLFGWEEARGARNTYKPKNTERAGSLFFVLDRNSADEDPEEVELSRIKNTDGLQGDTSLVADIDKETFKTMFSLNSDELRSLRNTTDVTAKLLTAGSGTSASPAHALSEVQERLVEYTSRAAGVEHSIVNLGIQQSDLRARMIQAAEEAERFKQQDKEFHELEPRRDELNARLNELNVRIEELTAYHANIQKLEEEYAHLGAERDQLREEEATLAKSSQTEEQAPDTVHRLDRLVNLNNTEDRTLREHIDAFLDEQAKVDHRVDIAKENYATSKAAYEALNESVDQREAAARARRQRHVQIALSVLLPLVFMLIGVPLFVHGRQITSLSFTALGIGLILFALMLAGAALVMLFRPNKAEEEREERLQNAQWVMLQDQKKLEACLANCEELSDRITAYLDDVGLGEAQGSLRRARALLDDAKDARAEAALLLQKQQAHLARRTALEENLAATKRQQEHLYARMGLGFEPTPADIEAEIARKVQQRTSLLETFEHMNRRYGELKQELSQAKHLKDFDELKLRYQQVRTRQNESARSYARLLLAKRMLESAIAAWESKSQPEVYRQASRLMKLMTAGRWVKVRMTQEGRLQVVDAVKIVRDPVHLSLGTCQQLYLSLRIALLLTADNVGRAVPILADDILVNFDAERRYAAACALAELARSRQVILFTCHQEIVDVLREADSETNVVNL